MSELYIFLTIVTVVQIWFIAIWGLCDMVIRSLAGKNRVAEAGIYILIIIAVLAYIRGNPTHMPLFSGL